MNFVAPQRSFSISIRSFFPNVNPDGLQLVDKSNWSGIGVAFSQINYQQAVCRPDFERVGVHDQVRNSRQIPLKFRWSNFPEILQVEAKGVTAMGYEDTKGVVIREGSEVVKAATVTIHQYMSTLRSDLLEEGVLVDGYRFVQDHVFDSPSTTAGVILGRTANRRVEWTTQDVRTLKDLQTQESASIEAED